MQAPTDTASRLVFFGDSLTDPGNLFERGTLVLEDAVIAGLGGPGGQASDGPVYAEYLAALLGLDPSLNYAVGGGEAGGTQPIVDFITENGLAAAIDVPFDDPNLQFDMNLGAQIDRYFADVSEADRGADVGFLLVGGNDYLDIDTGNILSTVIDTLATIGDVVTSNLTAADRLLDEGVGRVIVSSLPGGDFFPAIATADDLLKGLATAIGSVQNTLLEAGAAELGGAVRFLDMTILSDAIAEDASSFGLIAPLTLTLTGGSEAELAPYDDDQVAFWDSIHPSGATHGIIASFVSAALSCDVTALDDGDNVAGFGPCDNAVFGYAGDDVIRLRAGDDYAFGGSGADVLRGSSGSDLLQGGSGDDRVFGGGGRDIVAGGAGSDILKGRAGNDVIIGGLGADVMRGNRGRDDFVFVEPALIGGVPADGQDIVGGGRGFDTLYLVLGADHDLAAIADGLDTARKATLAELGIRAQSIEDIVIVDGRAGMADALGGERWFEAADLWGLL